MRRNAGKCVSKDARLEIENTATGEYLLYGPDKAAGKKNNRKFSHSTLLFQQEKGWQECIDRYPLMVPDRPDVQIKTSLQQ